MRRPIRRSLAFLSWRLSNVVHYREANERERESRCVVGISGKDLIDNWLDDAALNEFPRVVRGNENSGVSSDFSKNKRKEENGILRRLEERKIP
jgi:hypothetical protein